MLCLRFSSIEPIPSSTDHQEFHQADQQTKNIGRTTQIVEIKRRKFWDTTRRVQFVRQYLSLNSTILDIGSGYGTFLDELGQLGYGVVGLETSQIRCQISKTFGNSPVVVGDLYNIPKSLGTFDSVTMFHVLEHLLEPIKALTSIGSCLKSTGFLFIEVPNYDDQLLIESKSYRDFYWQKAHVSYFSPKTLRNTIEKAGLKLVEIIGVQRYGIENFMNWMVLGKPQLDQPSFEMESAYQWLEQYYKSELESSMRSDTLMAIVTV